MNKIDSIQEIIDKHMKRQKILMIDEDFDDYLDEKNYLDERALKAMINETKSMRKSMQDWE